MDDDQRDEFEAEMRRVDGDLVVARRMLAALWAGDHASVNAVMVEICRTGRCIQALFGMTLQALDFARELEKGGAIDDLQAHLDQLVFRQMAIMDGEAARDDD